MSDDKEKNQANKKKQIVTLDEFYDSCLAGINYYESRMYSDGSLADLMDNTLNDDSIKLGLMALTHSLLDIVSKESEMEIPEMLKTLRQSMIIISNEHKES
jgi:hypothetical protein